MPNNSRLIINKLRDYLGFSEDAQIADYLGLNRTTLSNQINRNSLDVKLLYTKCDFLDGNWLLSGGIGEMIKNKTSSSNDKDVKTVEINAEGIMSLLETIRNEQKELIINFEKIQGPLSLSEAMLPDVPVPADAAELIAKERARIAAGKRGARNEPIKQKVSGKK